MNGQKELEPDWILSEAAAGTEVRLTVPAAIAYEKAGDRGRFNLFREDEDL